MRTLSIIFAFMVLCLSSEQARSSISFAKDLSPKSDCDQKVEHRYYQVCYSDPHRLALWTSHWLTEEGTQGKTSRTNNYRPDHNLVDPVHHKAYYRSGYDRGHLVPAADMKLNYTSMSETFFMSNMSPQKPSFNRGVWKSLENHMRSLVEQNGMAYIVTAPLLSEELAKLPSGISIPNHFYKIAYFPEKELMLAYLISNTKHKNAKLSEFRVSVDELEELSGIDFFPALDDEIETLLEASKY